MRICNTDEIRELDQQAQDRYKIAPEVLMENAGRAAAEIFLETYPEAGLDSEILVFAGKGNNAGDAFVVARYLQNWNRKTRVFHLTQSYHGAAAKNLVTLKEMGAKLTFLENGSALRDFLQQSNRAIHAIDGLLGTGLRGNVDGVFDDVITIINECIPHIFSLDIPSGVNGNTGTVEGRAIEAEMTVSFGFPKLGHFLPPGAALRGKLINIDISLPGVFKEQGDKVLLSRRPLAQLLKKRDKYGHKNSFGHTFLLGGSLGKVGAISMAARACHRMGTGLVTASTWEECLPTLHAKLPDETMAIAIDMEEARLERYRQQFIQFSSLVIGPGLGQTDASRKLLELILSMYRGPMVIDADALNLISTYRMHDHLIKRQAPTVLTPHPGEMARLLGWDKSRVVADPVQAVKEAVNLTHAVVLLKGAATLIASPDEKIYLNHYPNDGMATAGTGDVLAGMIGGLLGQSMNSFEAAQLAVYLHSLAGELAAKKKGHRSMTATDIIENIGEAFREIKEDVQEPISTRTHLL